MKPSTPTGTPQPLAARQSSATPTSQALIPEDGACWYKEGEKSATASVTTWVYLQIEIDLPACPAPPAASWTWLPKHSAVGEQVICQGTIESADLASGTLYANTTTNGELADFSSVCNALFGSAQASTAVQSQRGFLATSPQWVQFIHWTETGQQITGYMEIAQLDSTNSSGLQSNYMAISGTQSGQDINLSVETVGTITGTLIDNTLTLVVPQQNGTLANETFYPATVDDYNNALAGLQQSVEDTQASATAAAAASAAAQAGASATAAATAAAINTAYTQISQQCNWNLHPIIDPAQLLTPAEHDALVAKVQKLNDAAYGAAYQPEVAVCILPSSVPGDIDGAAEQYREYWSLGLFILVVRDPSDVSQNQAVALASQQFRQKEQLQPSEQGPITQAMAPLVKEGKIDDAVSAGLDVAIARVQGGAPTP